jgi:uncharacterized membrane protein (UPF0127 family)
MTVLLWCTLGASAISLLPACDEPPKDGKSADKSPAAKEPKLETVTIAGKDFRLEPALDEDTRFKGLSGREDIKPDGGMLFVFPSAKKLDFVMRDCPIGIDVIFLDAAGRVTAFHKMVPEEPRAEDEKKLSPPYPGCDPKDWTNEKYESRLHRYGSKYSAQFVIELKAGTLDSLNIHEGDQVKLDVAGLKKRCK